MGRAVKPLFCVAGLEEGNGVEFIAQDLLGVGLEPLVEDGIIDATEIGGVLEVFFGVEVEVGALTQNAAFDIATHHKEGGGGAVVGAGAAVFSGAASKFGEGHGEDLVVAFIRFEVALEGSHGICEVAEEFGVFFELSGMGVVTGLGDVIDAGLHVGMNEGGNAFEGLAEITGGVLDLGFVICKVGLNAAFCDEGIHHGLLQIGRGAFDVRFVEEGLIRDVGGGFAAVEASAGTHSKDGGGFVGEVALRDNIADVDRAGVSLFGRTGAIVVEVAPEPTGGAVFVAIGGGFPDFGGTKVAAAGVGVANVLNNAEVALIEEIAELPEGGVQGEVVVHHMNIVAD